MFELHPPPPSKVMDSPLNRVFPKGKREPKNKDVARPGGKGQLPWYSPLGPRKEKK